jgi:hypothetical protein
MTPRQPSEPPSESGRHLAPSDRRVVLLSAAGLFRRRGRHRRRRRQGRRKLVVVFLAAAVGVAAFVARPGTPHRPAPAPKISGTAGDTKILLIDGSSTSYNWSQVAPAYQAVIVNDWETSWIPEIKAASRQTQVFVYKDLSSTRSNDCTGNPDGTDSCISAGVVCPAGIDDSSALAAGVGFCWAWRNQPRWFLQDSSGALLTEIGYPTQYMMDVGNPAYQAQWLANVKADVAANGWDGVFMDNVLDNINYGTPASYPTPAAIQGAMLSMLKVVGPGLEAAGVTTIGNLGYNNLYPSLWASWLPYVSGFMNEFAYFGPSNSPEGAGDWTRFLEPEVRACAGQEKVCIFNVGDSALTQREISFATASILLYSNGNSYISFGDGTGGQDPHVTLGAAKSNACESDGMWRRDFVHGYVSVNPVAGSSGDEVRDCS